jgi:hypothetical protein
MKKHLWAAACLLAAGCLFASLRGSVLEAQQIKEYKSGIVWPEPAVIDPGPPGGAPSDAVILFDGKDLSKWKNGENWEIKDGYAVSRKSDITTIDSFGDCQIHVEFATPEEVKGSSQGRGNSGVFLMDRYEVQILDSYDNKTYFDGQCGSIYKQSPPMVNCCRKPGEWQTYDILFETPKFDEDGKVTRPAYITVLQNGVVVQNHFEIQGNTSWDKAPAYTKVPEKMPIHLQFHGNPVRFRNIWIREMKPIVGQPPEEKKDGKD